MSVFLDNPPSSWCLIFNCSLFQLHNVMLPPPCFRDGKFKPTFLHFFELKFFCPAWPLFLCFLTVFGQAKACIYSFTLLWTVGMNTKQKIEYAATYNSSFYGTPTSDMAAHQHWLCPVKFHFPFFSAWTCFNHFIPCPLPSSHSFLPGKQFTWHRARKHYITDPSALIYVWPFRP